MSDGEQNLDRVLSPKLIVRDYGTMKLHYHWCPGCEVMHSIAVEQPFRNGARWTFDRNAEKPTFSPSINVGPGTKLQCHYFIRAGRIEFCGDSHHALAGQTVDLPDIPEEELR
ncbi:MAG: hypothetical protein RJA36_1438 [Pseudomonadota bacterium]|jgi:hypothetical protein